MTYELKSWLGRTNTRVEIKWLRLKLGSFARKREKRKKTKFQLVKPGAQLSIIISTKKAGANKLPKNDTLQN